MKFFATLASLIWIIGAAPAVAQSTNPVVVELFTSQGCSSCPPADKLMHELAARDGVIALALHVDYWDYIGWKDQFADPAHTERQKAYAVAAGRRSVYTPQMIVNGTDSVVGARAMELADLIVAHAAKPVRVAVDLNRLGDELRIRAERRNGEPQAAMIVQMARFTPERTIDITRGENAGRTLTYVNVVSDLEIVAEWTGAQPLDLRLPVTGEAPVAVLVQYEDFGPILGAAKLD